MTPALLTFALLLSGDPRPRLVALQIEGRPQEALAETEAVLDQRPNEGATLGLPYLRGRLLQQLHDWRRASAAFAETMGSTPPLAAHARFQLALAQEQLGHPEVAAGLVATLLGSSPPSTLLEPAMELLTRTLRKGGDCRLLRTLALRPFPSTQRRLLALSRADCALRGGDEETARRLLVGLLDQSASDLAAWEAAERLAALGIDEGSPRVAGLLGLAFHHHRDFERAQRYLEQLIARTAGSAGVDFETHYRWLRSYFWRGKFELAAAGYGSLAATTDGAGDVTRAFFHQGRSYELVGSWPAASDSYRRSYLAQPQGPFSGAALVSVLRLAWRRGHEDQALELLSVLRQRRQWRSELARADLFLASSDLVRGRSDRAEAWLTEAERSDRAAAAEVVYWRGRRAELENDPAAAVEHYLRLLRDDLHHPLAAGARERLEDPTLRETATELGRRLARSQRLEDLHGAWLLLGDDDGEASRLRLEAGLARDRSASPYLSLAPVPVEEWPLWSTRLTRPEEMLLALGDFEGGAAMATRHFPVAVPNLAFTAARQLLAAGETRRALWIAEVLYKRLPDRVPDELLPSEFRRLLHPLSFRGLLERASRRHQIDPTLLAAIIREESRFDPRATSAAGARGLTQFVLPTAERLAGALGLAPLQPEDLEEPEVAIELGAAYLAELSARYSGKPTPIIAAYNAGEAQVQLWQSYCYSFEPEELFTKVSFRETRAYLTRVLRSRSQYRAVYGDELP
jgi:soluble lytic murein transglycosylase-like protein